MSAALTSTATATITTTSYGRERITIGDYALVIVPRAHDDRYKMKSTRLFGAIDTLGGELAELLEANNRRPVSPEYDDFASDVERNAHMREYRSLKRRLTAHVREQADVVLNTFALASGPHLLVGLVSTKMKFSIHAGCTMCPCSPGFILQRVVLYRDRPVDIHIERAVVA